MSYEVIVLDVDGIGKEAMEVNSEAETISWIVTDIKNPYHSRNLGISRSSGSYIVLLDAKCEVQSGYLKTVAKLKGQDDVLTAGPYQVNASSSSIKDQVYSVFYLLLKSSL